ncbi:unnamed protein product [Ranitomeya imitator]|uniref:Reverse transcriptase domain-containing protein n=1 Tax=Ranitomeya imitator TaxID=111125 RepID=A0ABN9KQB2_9NEOB|nr:unnamed protein product [Ranitomeya imitator]
MDKTQYITEIHRQLDDTSVYDKLQRDPTSEIKGKIDAVIAKYLDLGIIDTKTGDFLKYIRELQRVPVDTILVTLDVKDLYTSIPHLNGINAVHHSLTIAGFTTNQIDLCVELLTIVLYNNFFLFQDTFYLQKRGTAMDSNVAPPYANTYMTEFETSIIYRHPLFKNVSLWKRFIDDISCVWGGTLESLQDFFQFLNGAWPGIKFTMSHDSHSINFLDTMVLKDQAGYLTTDLFSKPTDRNTFTYTAVDTAEPAICIGQTKYACACAVAEDQKRTSYNEDGRRRSGPETPIRPDQQRDRPWVTSGAYLQHYRMLQISP